MKLPTKPKNAGAPAAPGDPRTRLAEITTILEGWRLLTPYTDQYLHALAAGGDFAAVEAARQQMQAGTGVARVQLELERCHLVKQIAEADVADATAARRTVQAQIDDLLRQRQALQQRLLALRDEDNRLGGVISSATALQAATDRELEGWADSLAGTTPEQRWRRRGGRGRYLGLWGVQIQGWGAEWHGPRMPWTP